MFFDRYEIHIQAFVHFINGRLVMFNPHLHKIIFEICIQKAQEQSENNSGNIESIWYLGHTDFEKNAKFCESQIVKNNICPR